MGITISGNVIVPDACPTCGTNHSVVQGGGFTERGMTGTAKFDCGWAFTFENGNRYQTAPCGRAHDREGYDARLREAEQNTP